MGDNRKIWIYTLSDPRDGLVKYIGKTFRPKRRMYEHLTNLESNTKKVSWIKSLKQIDLLPVFEILEETDIDNCDSLEIYWISQFKNWGFELKNHTNGGGGSYGVIPWNKGRKGIFKHSEKSKRKMSEYRKENTSGEKNGFFGKTHSDENKKRWGHIRKGKKWTEEVRVKNSGKSSSNCKKVYCYDVDKNLIKIYDFGRQVTEDGFDWNCVSKVCRKINKTHKNHIFSYEELNKNK
jgi:group I intron endonuclease